jgi:hypothetical protein
METRLSYEESNQVGQSGSLVWWCEFNASISV